MKLLRLSLAGLALPVAAGSTGSRPAAGNLQSSIAQPSGSVAPDFIVSTGVGSSFSLDEHRGDVVVLYFSFPG